MHSMDAITGTLYRKCGEMTIGNIIDRILKYHAESLIRTDIQKPFAWSVYQTWKWVDEQEKPRKKGEISKNLDG